MFDRDRVVLAEILRPRGNRGEVVAVSQTDVPGRLEALTAANVRLANGSDLPVVIEEVWPHGEHWVLKFAGIETIDAADKFRGSDLWVPSSERACLPEGEYFRTDLLGCMLTDAVTGEAFGPVESFEQYGGPMLLQISVKGREVLVPFVPEICRKVDVAGRVILVALPEGLLDL